MDTGIGYFPTHDALDPASMARLVEVRGHGALYFAEHTHIPASRQTAWSGGATLPRRYAHTLDLFVALTAAATATRRLRVGWNREEMANHGTDPRTRMRLMRERVEAMRAIWTQEEASYRGEFVDFERIWSWPKPLQRPGPPVLVGGGGPTVFDRVLAFGDAWFAQHRERPLERIDELRARAREAGRDIPVDVIGVPPKAEVIERYEAAGVRRVSMWAPPAGRGVIEAALDAFERAVADVHGE